jgi:hypothetical protein
MKRWWENKWNLEWETYSCARMSKLFIKGANSQFSKKAMKLGRPKLGTLIRVITGHNALNYFRNKVDGDIDPTCRFCCEDMETFWHLANECPVFANRRREIIDGWEIGDREWSVEMLLEMADTTQIAKALEGYVDIWYEDDQWAEVRDGPEPEPD